MWHDVICLSRDFYFFTRKKIMGRKKELTAEQHGAIFYYRQHGDSYQKIADTVGCGKTTVFDTLKRYAKTGSMKSRSRSGRPYLINNNQRKWLKRLVTNDKTQNRRLCASGVKKLWKKKTEQDVSENTIRHALYSVGLNNRIT